MTANETRDKEISTIYSFRPLNEKQHHYYNSMVHPDTKCVFGVGPSGTGKSIVPLKAAFDLLNSPNSPIDKILIATEACEVGHRIGHLPGDIHEKLDPYFESVVDNLNEMTGQPELVKHLIDNDTIQFKSINFIRGSTFRNAAVILDEAQNTTRAGMKAFLTRIGAGSRVFVNGDENQVDDERLRNGKNGLSDAVKRLFGFDPRIQFTFFTRADCVRDDIVIAILEAYEEE